VISKMDELVILADYAVELLEQPLGNRVS